MTTYKVIETPLGEQIIKIDNNGVEWWISQDPSNADYQAYLNKDNPDYGKPFEL